MKIAIGMTALLASGLAYGKTVEVGAGKTYTSPCVALAASGAVSAGDEIDVDSGTYTDSCEVNLDNLTIKGIGASKPIFDLSGTDHPADYKGIFVVNGANVRLENLELTGANISDTNGANGAGIRAVGDGLVVHGCYIHDNQDGILATAADSTGTITVEYTELAKNGRGDGCVAVSCTHNIYVNGYGHLVFQYNWSHDIANDTAEKGHLLKSRALQNDILYNRITGEAGPDSYEIDLPNGGLSIVVGNVVEKGPNAGNPTLLDYGEEGLSNPDMRLFVAYNTFVNDKGSGTFINVASGGTLAAHDNLFAGTGTISSTGALSADNLATATSAAMFMDATNYDYRIAAGSPGVGMAVDPGMADTTSLVPAFEYLQPTSASARATHMDIGAYEHGAQGPAIDAGTLPSADAGTTSGGDAGILVHNDGGVTSGDDGGSTGTTKKHGCDYGEGRAIPPLVALALAVLIIASLRRRAER